MTYLILLVQQYGLWIVFGLVLLAQIGLPVPAFPLLIVAGALVVDADTNWLAVLAASLSGCLIADYFWFRTGRLYGKRILTLLCRISLSPDYCVRQTEGNFRRWGPKALVVAKFIPGFNTIAPPLAGAMGTQTSTFLLYSVLGGLLWSGAGVAVGAYFHSSVDDVLELLGRMGSTAMLAVGALLILFVGFKYLERKRFQQRVMAARINTEQLKGLIAQGVELVLIDARNGAARAREAGIPGAFLFNEHEPVAAELATLTKDRHIVVYCTCPDDIGAALVAQQLFRQGYHRTRPLSGGLEAWNSAFLRAEPAFEADFTAALPV